MHTEQKLEKALKRKIARKAKPGGSPKWINLPRNWLHQAITYMDMGELLARLIVEAAEIVLVLLALRIGLPDIGLASAVISAVVIVHTWNWVTNGLFWNVLIVTFPNLKNPGARATVDYLNSMRDRLKKHPSITGLLVYGSVTRGAWHDRSDIDIRILRAPGASNLLISVLLTMKERFRAFLERQPMDLYLADGVNFLMKMRQDEKPVLLINRDARLLDIYTDNQERAMMMEDLLGPQ